MNIAVIFAGGVGRRMNNKGLPKQFLKIHNTPIIIHTLEKFQKCEKIDAIVVACVATHIDYMREIIKEYRITKVKNVVEGGTTGQLSIYNALKAAKKISKTDQDIVLVHDGVRPIIDSDLICRNIESVEKYGSAISSVPQKETTIILNNEKKYIDSVTNREFTYIARAPQSFYLNELLECHEKILKEGENNCIDSASLMMKYGKKLAIVECNTDNIKITTPDDYYIVKAILEAKENMQILGAQE